METKWTPEIVQQTFGEIFDKARLYDKLLKMQGKKELSCSFCGKSESAIAKLIAGAGVYICNECVTLCQEIINEEKKEEESEQ